MTKLFHDEKNKQLITMEPDGSMGTIPFAGEIINGVFIGPDGDFVNNVEPLKAGGLVVARYTSPKFKPEEHKKRGPKPGSKRMPNSQRSCSICGKAGHTRVTCTGSDGPGGSAGDAQVPMERYKGSIKERKGPKIPFDKEDPHTQEVIVYMLDAGKNSLAISEHFDISMGEANEAIGLARSGVIARKHKRIMQ